MSILEVFKKSKKADPSKEVKKVKKTTKASITKTDKPEVKTAKVSGTSKKSFETLPKGDAHQVVIRPLITEKASDVSVLNQYTFEVSIKTNKIEIKKAIRALYNVDPVKVRVMNKPGRLIRRGRHTGVTKKWKKAIVTLKAGDKIEFFSGV